MSAPLEQLEAAYGIRLDATQKHFVRVYLQLLERWRRRINLTSIARTEALLKFHFFESFWAADRFLEADAAVADVGSGTGFPGLAMKLYRPSLQVTLIERTHKKVVFLKEVARRLALDVETFEGRAEDYSAWPACDVAAFRALKPSQQLLQTLRSCGVSLLCFHAEPFDSPSRFRLIHREKVPESQGRYVALLTGEKC